MIQRKQTLFLFQLIFLGIALLFVPCNIIITSTGTHDVCLVPLKVPDISSTPAHMTAVAINFFTLILTFLTIFLYGKRELQLRLCYVLAALWAVLALMMAFCPFVEKNSLVVAVQINYFGPV